MKISFKDSNHENYVPITSKDKFHNQQFKLISTGNVFHALALYSEGFISKTYKGPEKEGNPTFGIGINLASLTAEQRKEGMLFSGFSQKEINNLNQSMAKGKIPEVKINLEQALNFAEWHRQNISGPAAEKFFGKDFLEKLPPMRKAAIEYVFFHYGENGALKMKNLMNKLKNEDFAFLEEHATSSRGVHYKGKDVLFPNSRTGLILDLAFKDMGAGEFFFLSAVGINGENVRKIDAMANDYDKMAKLQMIKLEQAGKLKPKGNNFIKISKHTDEYIDNLDDEKLKDYLKIQKALKNKKGEHLDFLTEEEVLNVVNEEFNKIANNNGLDVKNKSDIAYASVLLKPEEDNQSFSFNQKNDEHNLLYTDLLNQIKDNMNVLGFNGQKENDFNSEEKLNFIKSNQNQQM